MPRKTIEFPKFKNESDEADWWASKEGRAFAEQRSREAQAKGIKFSGSPFIAKLNKKGSTQIAIRLPGADIEEARKIAGRKGIGYQTLLKMIVHEGLRRESRRG
jgi:predicted DNA binding CopG/RHH family protein